MQYFVGAHRAHWLAESEQPLFVSHRTLRRHKALPRARAPWALDSGAFTEIGKHGRWLTTPRDYAAAVRRYRDEIGNMVFASPQDWMCEPEKLAITGLTVEEHQLRTVNNYLELESLAPDLPWIPVLQGWSIGDYQRCAELYALAGVELAKLPRVGVGSVCKRSNIQSVANILGWLAADGFKLHAFGVKADALPICARYIASADSMAWSASARHEKNDPGGDKDADPNELATALAWYQLRIAPKLRKVA